MLQPQRSAATCLHSLGQRSIATAQLSQYLVCKHGLQMHVLHVQICAVLCEHEVEMHQVIVLCGAASACAGQAVVQFAYHSVSRAEYAIKFFVSATAFKDESNQYMNKDSPLVQFFPKMHALVDNSNGDFQDAFGRSMPPCIVMERGESLDKWVLRNKRALDMFTCMQVQLPPSCVLQFDEIHQAAYSVEGVLH
jgi:hypothetical protein